MRLLTLAFVLAITLTCSAADKVYQTGKFLNVDSQEYSKYVSNPTTGSGVSVERHDNHLSVQVGDIIYVGECQSGSVFSSCKPGKWIVGDPIQVRIDKDNMYLLKPGGGEVKTKIVKRIRVPQ